MSQPSVAEFFSSRKRPASDDLHGKAKVMRLDINQDEDYSSPRTSDPQEHKDAKPAGPSDRSRGIQKSLSVVRNIQFDSPKGSTSRSQKTMARKPRTRRASAEEGQIDIRETILKMSSGESKNVPFEKKGILSPKKRMPTLSEAKTPVKNKDDNGEQPACGSVTPKKAPLVKKGGLDGLKNLVKSKSVRLQELRASVDKMKNLEEKLKKIDSGPKKTETIRPQQTLGQLREDIILEVPVMSPQKVCQSPSKLLMSPRKTIELPRTASPQTRTLHAPKEMTPSPVKSSPTKVPAYKRYKYLVEKVPTLTLPFHYQRLVDIFQCIETVVAMLYNRKETITFSKLKPAVQEMLRKNLSTDHLAQIKNVYPNAYEFRQEKVRQFGVSSKSEKYELVIVPLVEDKSGRNTPDEDNVLKSASETSMNPSVLLERRKKFTNILVEKVMDEHEEFLKSLDPPMIIPRKTLKKWHPAFPLENCKPIEKADIPKPPEDENMSAKNVLDKAKDMFGLNTRMGKALQLLKEQKMISTSSQTIESSNAQCDSDHNVSSIVDTPPSTPTTQIKHLNRMFKGIPKSLLEKVRERQAAKALESMTRPAHVEKEIVMYARLPEMAQIIRGIFVVEKKNVLTLEFVLQKLDNSYKTKLTLNELENHVRLICRLLPMWASIHNVRKVDYLKLAKNIQMAQIIERLENEANNKASSASKT